MILDISVLVRPGTPASGIMVALGFGLTLLATVALLEASVEAQVENQLPAHVPSFFFVDVQKDQIDDFTKSVQGLPSAQDFTATPMLRGRVMKLAGIPAETAAIAPRARWVVNSDRNVSYASEPPKDAKVVEGPKWWPADYRGPTLVSFDSEIAHDMGLKLGDTITLNVLGRDIDARIFNLRDIDFRTGGINFIFILSKGVIDTAPHSFLATVRTAPGSWPAWAPRVWRSWPPKSPAIPPTTGGSAWPCRSGWWRWAIWWVLRS